MSLKWDRVNRRLTDQNNVPQVVLRTEHKVTNNCSDMRTRSTCTHCVKCENGTPSFITDKVELTETLYGLSSQPSTLRGCETVRTDVKQIKLEEMIPSDYRPTLRVEEGKLIFHDKLMNKECLTYNFFTQALGTSSDFTKCASVEAMIVQQQQGWQQQWQPQGWQPQQNTRR